MINKPMITVIVPIYNVEKYVAKCLKSLEKQTFKDFVIWAVIDGSPDNSDKVVEKFSKEDPRIRLIKKENGGYGSVLDYSIKNIETKYFIICDPDDWLAPKALETLVKIAEKNNLDLVIGDRYDVYANKHTVVQEVKPKELNCIEPNKVYTNLEDIQYFAFFDVSPHAKLYRTSKVQGIEFPKHVSYTDFLLYTIAISKVKRIFYYNTPLAFYLIERVGNTATDVRVSTIKDNIKVWNSTLKQINKNKKILLYYMYLQFCPILNKYALLTDRSYSDSYWGMILDSLSKIEAYSQNINPIPSSKLKKYKIENYFFKKIFKKGLSVKYVKKYLKVCVIKNKIKSYLKRN